MAAILNKVKHLVVIFKNYQAIFDLINPTIAVKIAPPASEEMMPVMKLLASIFPPLPIIEPMSCPPSPPPTAPIIELTTGARLNCLEMAPAAFPPAIPEIQLMINCKKVDIHLRFRNENLIYIIHQVPSLYILNKQNLFYKILHLPKHNTQFHFAFANLSIGSKWRFNFINLITKR